MRVPRQWLHDWCAPALSTSELADRLDMTGTKVERIERHGVGSEEEFVVGRVLEATQHPDADRLTVCRVTVGDGDMAQIVCGAPNVAAGQTVAVARPGAIMPGGQALGAATLRGIESEGMILAEDELGIGTDHGGIMVLAEDLRPGTPLAEVLPIATDVLELEITPNRPDCLGVYGVAREVHAATGTPLAPPPWQDDPGSAGEVAGAAVSVEDPDLCPRFTARAFEGVRVGPSPPWLKARLMAAGQRPILNVVDITNYVMLASGQPLHAFDLDRVPGGRLIVRRAREGEELETLDGVVRRLDGDMVLVCDEEGPSGIGGIIGGARSEVSGETTRVLMEVATWVGPNVHRTSTRLGLRTEASARFEKQLSPDQAMEAQALASKLMVEVCGARLVPGTIDVGGPGPTPPPIRLRDARVTGLLGAELTRARSAAILESLGFGTAEAPEGLDVSVPHFRRGDVGREIDLVEEVGRVDGFERLPATLPPRAAGGGLDAAQRMRRRAEDALAGAGLHEVVGWSLTAPDIADRLRLPAGDERRRLVALANPMSEEQSVMRPALLGSLLDTTRHNLARGHADLRLFEYGPVYRTGDDGGLPDERRHIAAILVGAARPPTWRDPAPPRADFYAAKGLLARLLDTLRARWSVEAATEPFLHPGQAAAVLVDGARVGWVGEIHPLVARAWEVDAGAAAFEVDLGALAPLAGVTPMFRDLVGFPSVRQDIAVTVAHDVPAGRVLEVVRAAGGATLERVEVFDVYRGEQAGEGRTSLGMRLEFRAPDRTLTDEEAAERRAEILAALQAELGASLRA